jgi:integrase
MAKNSKGTVVVEAFRDRLRLRWTYQGKRYYLSMELPDTITNRKVAEAKARLIEMHLVTGIFDKTLASYRLEASKYSALTVVELFQKFIEYKAKDCLPQSLVKYRGLMGYLTQFFRSKTADSIGESEAENFKAWLAKKVEPVTLRERITLLNACWKWAIKRKWLVDNPWSEVKVRVPRRQKPKPFTKDEIRRIIEGFRNDSDYSHYADYVEFLIGTGCRLGEAIALRWRHLNDDCSVCHFIEAHYRGQFKGLKTEDERFVSLTPRLQALLIARRPEKPVPNDLIFTTPNGHPISDQNFRRRAWTSILDKLNIPYRKPRTTRATLVSHALDRGMTPAEVSELTGHTQETLFRHYAGNVKNRPQLPDLLD